jgi:hypothetical protein
MEPTENSQQAESISARMQRAINELKILEQLILCGDFPPRLLREFRDALDSIRSTARVVQLWAGLQEQQQSGDSYSAFDAMASDRVRRATEIAKKLTIDLESVKVDFETEQLMELYRAVNDLQERLAPNNEASAKGTLPEQSSPKRSPSRSGRESQNSSPSAVA